MKMKVTQLYLSLCDLMGYTVHGILQARILEWVAIPFSRGSSQPRDQTQAFRIAGIKPRPSALQANSLPAEPPGKPNWKNHSFEYLYLCWKNDVSVF